MDYREKGSLPVQKRILPTMDIQTKAQLIDAVFTIWDNFPIESINSLVENFEARLGEVNRADGEPITALLSGNKELKKWNQDIPVMSTIPIDQIIKSYDPNIIDSPIELKSSKRWTRGEKLVLMAKAKDYNYDYDELAKLFPGRNAIACEKCYKRLVKKLAL